MTARAQAIARTPEERRVATLVAFGQVCAATAQDDALDLLNLLVGSLLARVKRWGEHERLRTLGDLDAAALRLRAACLVLLDEAAGSPDPRAAVFQRVSRDDLALAVQRVGELAREADDRSYYAELLGRYSLVRRFLPILLSTVVFEGTEAGDPVLEALACLRRSEGSRAPRLREAPRRLSPDPGADSCSGRPAAWIGGYTLCTLERLQDALHRREIFVTPSERWSDPRTKILQGAAWTDVRADVCRARCSEDPQAELEALTRELGEAYQRAAAGLPDNAAARIETERGRVRLT